MLLFQGNSFNSSTPANNSRLVFSDTPAETPRDPGRSILEDSVDSDDNEAPFWLVWASLSLMLSLSEPGTLEKAKKATKKATSKNPEKIARQDLMGRRGLGGSPAECGPSGRGS